MFTVYNEMLKTYKSTLNLNSYKLDTRGYEQKIKQLIEQNAQLKYTAHQSKSKENQLFQQLRNTKLEVSTLRNMLKSQFVVHDNKCRNCATYSKQSIDRLLGQLEAEKSKAAEFKKMYENEVENKKQLSDYYQKKFQNILKDKDILVKKYEQKIKYLSSHNLSMSQSFESSTTTRKSQQDLSVFPDRQSEKQRKKYPPPLPKLNTPRGNNSPSQKRVSIASSEDSLTSLTSPIIEKLNKMQISFQEMKSIPQVQRFYQSVNPPKNRFIKLLRDFPFECSDDDLIEQSYKQIMQYIQYNEMQNTGENLINYLIYKMENS